MTIAPRFHHNPRRSAPIPPPTAPQNLHVFSGKLNRQIAELRSHVSYRKQIPTSCSNRQKCHKCKTRFSCRICMRSPSRIETAGTADKRIAALVKSKKPVSLHPDPNAHADSNFPCSFRRSPQPQGTFSAQIHPIQTSSNAHRRSESPGPARKVSQRRRRFFACNFSRSFDAPSSRLFFGAMVPHPLDAFERLQPAQKNSFADSFALPGNVEHEVVAINKINVSVSAFQEKRPVARRHSTKGVASRIAHKVRFGLNDAPAEPNMRQVVHQRLADQKTCQLDGVDRQLAAAQSANPNFSARERHAIRSIIRTLRVRLTLFLDAVGEIDERQSIG